MRSHWLAIPIFGLLLGACLPDGGVADVSQFSSSSSSVASPPIDVDELYDALGDTPFPDAAPQIDIDIDSVFDDIDYEIWIQEIEDGDTFPHSVDNTVVNPPEPPYQDDNDAESPPWWHDLDPTELQEILDEEHDIFGEPIFTT